MSRRLFWKNSYEYQRILEIIAEYWLSEKDEAFVCVDMSFIKADGQRQEKTIIWKNPDIKFESDRNLTVNDAKELIDKSFSESTADIWYKEHKHELLHMDDA